MMLNRRRILRRTFEIRIRNHYATLLKVIKTEQVE